MSERRASLPSYPSLALWAGGIALSFGLTLIVAALVVWFLGFTNTPQSLIIHLAGGWALQIDSLGLGLSYLAALALGGAAAWWAWHRRFVRRMQGELRQVRAARDRLRLAHQALSTAADTLAPLPWGKASDDRGSQADSQGSVAS